MALAITSSTQATQNTGTTLSVNYPASVAVGNLLVMHMMSSQAISTPSGWTLADSGTRTSLFAYAFYKIADSGDVGQSTLGVTVLNGFSEGYMMRVTGHDATTPVASHNNATGTAATVTVTTITPAKVSNMPLFLIGSRPNTSSASVSAYALATSNPTFTELYDSDVNSSGVHYQMSAAYAIRPEATAYGSATATESDGNSWVGIILSISPADESNTVTPAVIAIATTLSAITLLVSSNFAPSAIALPATQPAPTVTTQHYPAFSNTTKHAATFTDTTKHSAAATNTAKHAATMTNVQKTS